ncbi:MAG TPA: DUF559 domain-containing protein [Acidimicrobiia bacterium]|nr:DUF559 domain-containing protein [Acidimicrobiia bacterium]
MSSSVARCRSAATGGAHGSTFLHKATRTVIEIQSERYHSALTDVAADAARRAHLESAGYTVIEVWDRELFTNPGLVVERVLQALHRAA